MAALENAVLKFKCEWIVFAYGWMKCEKIFTIFLVLHMKSFIEPIGSTDHDDNEWNL